MSEQDSIILYFDPALEPYKSLIEKAFEAHALMARPCFEAGSTAVFRAPLRFGVLLDYMRNPTVSGGGSGQKLTIGPYSLDCEQGLLEPVPEAAGGAIRLTDKECAILRILHDAAGAVVTREQLLREVWDYADGVETHTAETHIYRLRQKIEADSAAPKIILTDGAGYRLGSG